MNNLQEFDEDIQKIQEKIIDEIKQKTNLTEKIKLGIINQVLIEKKKQDMLLEKEIKLLKNKYEQLSKPLYAKINNIVNGAEQIEEQKYQNLHFLQDNEKQGISAEQCNKSQIEHYWLKVLKNCEIIGQIKYIFNPFCQLAPELKPQDEEALKTLEKLEYSTNPDNFDFVLIFTFKENEFFDSCVIRKEFKMKDDQTPIKSFSNQFPWKQGKKLNEKIIKKKQKSKVTGEIRIKEKAVVKESFFNFFKNVDREVKEKSTDDCASSIELQFDIASYIMEEAIPYSLECYLGVKVEGEDEFEDLDDDDDDFEEQMAAFEKKKKQQAETNSKEEKQDQQSAQPQSECKQQ